MLKKTVRRRLDEALVAQPAPERGGGGCRHTWAPELVARYQKAVERFAEMYGVGRC